MTSIVLLKYVVISIACTCIGLGCSAVSAGETNVYQGQTDKPEIQEGCAEINRSVLDAALTFVDEAIDTPLKVVPSRYEGLRSVGDCSVVVSANLDLKAGKLVVSKIQLDVLLEYDRPKQKWIGRKLILNDQAREKLSKLSNSEYLHRHIMIPTIETLIIGTRFCAEHINIDKYYDTKLAIQLSQLTRLPDKLELVDLLVRMSIDKAFADSPFSPESFCDTVIREAVSAYVKQYEILKIGPNNNPLAFPMLSLTAQ